MQLALLLLDQETNRNILDGNSKRTPLHFVCQNDLMIDVVAGGADINGIAKDPRQGPRWRFLQPKVPPEHDVN